jgi:hypothetical protein
MEPWLESDSAYWMPDNPDRGRSGWKFGRSVFWFAAGLIVLGAVGVLLVVYAMARFYDGLTPEPRELPGL